MAPVLVTLAPHDLAAILAAAGAPPAAAAAVPALGDRSVVLALQSGGAPLAVAVATEVPNLFGHGPEGLLRLFELSTPDAPAREHLLQAVAAEGRRRGWVFLRALRPWADARAAPFAGPWELSSVTVSKALARPQPWRGRPPAALRTAGAADLPFVVELTCAALARGLCPCERRRVGAPGIRAGARRFLGELTGPDMAVLVAEAGGAPVGHALGHLAVRDDTTAVLEAELYDAFVLERHQGRGIARLLVAGMEYLAWEAGRRRLRGTVGGQPPGSVDRVLGRLGRAGWRPERVTLVRPLAD